ncbi:SusC/RagA family TonB-linked outer membrane protein [Dysgonomonas macrotermitis]|uniref:TonB-linked outer membrane protein, SusC/RagA family n=1 Tax=Dysgonomonas macrotermitis TaxID=1346286 RepID=A0A1M4VPZ7_9BACT|nr:TonB-dependent receptor [Dysgonomonas macrotermitis]SHE70930.1 TonB-linked outer membrane protein, SusC/RagA family [Dysgonomonas macrotermitis]
MNKSAQVRKKKRQANPKSLFIALFFCIISISIYGDELQQTRDITGIVKSESDGEPLIGVSVTLKGGSTGTITDINGQYTIRANEGQTIVFSYVSFLTQEIKVGTQKSIDVFLKEDTKLLGEVVVVGYGTMKRSDITGSVISVSADDIKKTVATSVDQALQGRAAGVSVTQNSGLPGGGVSVSIRGTNSLNGNEPLYIIDGIAISGQTGGNTSALASLNPADIVSMEILKDASATAIYGSRASNGVIIITTRRGHSGKTKLSYEGYYGIQQIPDKIDVLNLQEFAEFYNARVAILGWGEREEFADPSILGKGTDWQSEIFRTAPMHNHQLSITGGNENTQFAVSGGYLSQDGIAIGSSFERFSARANLDTQINKWLKFGLNSNVSRFKRYNTVEHGDNIIRLAIRQFPDVPAKNPDGSWGVVAENNTGTYFSNPVADAMMRENYDKGLDVNMNAYASIDIMKGLNFRVEYGGNFNYNNNYQFTPLYDYDYFTQASFGSRSASNSNYMTFKTYATYNKDFGKHSLTAMLGHEAQEWNSEGLSGSRTGYQFNSVHELPAGDALTAKNSSSKGSSAIESYYGRFNYSFNDRYLLTATMRADGSSAFGPNNRWGYFPSFALAWKLKNEEFLKNVDVVSGLKLRLGWGLVGNQNAGNYAYGSTMSTVATVWGTGYYQQKYPNENLKWEKTYSYNAGIDLTLFNNRVEFILDGYYKETDNMLTPASLPSYISGIISSPWVNVGAMNNKGFEFTLNTVNISNNSLEWKTGLTFSLNRNKVTALYTETAGLSGVVDGKTYTYTQVGQPVGQFYGYKVKGMFTTEDDFYAKDKNGNYLLDANGNKKFVALPTDKTVKENEIWYGDYIWEDLNGDGVIDEKDRTSLGNPEPKFTYGINNTFTYKGFDLNIFINGVYGNKIYNFIREENTIPTNNTGLLKENIYYARVDLIDPNGDRTLSNMYVSNAGSAKVQRITPHNANDNNRTSDRFIESGSYLRVKNISLGYTFPKSWTGKWGVEYLRVYCNIQNPFTITNYSGYDPEIGAYNQNVLLRGIDYARYPSQRIYTFGLNVNF